MKMTITHLVVLASQGEYFPGNLPVSLKKNICQVTLSSNAVFAAEVEDDEEILACRGISGKIFPWEFASQ